MKLIPGLTSKTQFALTAALLFFIIAHPMTYKLVESLVGPLVGTIASPMGCPTNLGLLAHAVVFGAAAYYLL